MSFEMMSSETRPKSDGDFSRHSASASGRWRDRLRRLAEGFSAALGVGKNKTSTSPSSLAASANDLAQERTDLAIQRTYWSADRTLMGWIRTALAMISFGFTIGKLGGALQGIEANIRPGELYTLGFFLLGLGLASLIAATIQYGARVAALSDHGLPRQLSITFTTALALILIGILALAALIFRQ
jgi:putative membrane protein